MDYKVANSIKKLIFIFIFLAFLVLGTFALFGTQFDQLFDYQQTLDLWRSHPQWGWLSGVSALVGDIILPLPATGIMALLGKVYGFWLGTLFSFSGSFLAGLIGYFVAKVFRERGAHRVVTETDLNNFKQIFDRWGAVTIMVCRALPVLPEVTTVMAGLAGMPLRKFIPALFVGSLVTSSVFTALGLYGKDDSLVGLIASVLLPAIIWLIIVLNIKIKRSKKRIDNE